MYGIVISYGYVFIFFLIDEIADIYIYICISIYIYIPPPSHPKSSCWCTTKLEIHALIGSRIGTTKSKVDVLIHDKIRNPCLDRQPHWKSEC